MLSQIAIKNITIRKLRSFLAILSISIGSASLFLFMGLNNGIQNATFEEYEKNTPLNQITVRPNTDNSGILSIFSSENNQLNETTIQNISNLSGVKAVYPELQFNNFASIEAKILGSSLITDSMVFGLDKDFIKTDLSNPIIWDETSEPLPAIVPRKLLDIYNFSIATPQGLPLLSEETLIGKSLILYPNYSTFFPGMSKKNKEINLEIVGFSDKTNLIGVSLPLQIVKDLNNTYSNNSTNKYTQIYVETTDPAITSEVASNIEDLGLKTIYLQKNLKQIQAKFDYLTIALGIISFIILLTASIAIISTFLATIAERTKEIGLLRALGATKKHIKKLILIEASIIGVIGSFVGLILGSISQVVLNEYAVSKLQSIQSIPDQIIQTNIYIITITLLFGTLLSVLSAYLPAIKASNLSPIKALNK